MANPIYVKAFESLINNERAAKKCLDEFAVSKIAPIVVEILFVELAEQKDWSGKRDRS